MNFFSFLMLLLLDIPKNIHSTWKIDSKRSTILDMSKACVNNLEQDVYLPYGMGTADALVVVISNTYNLRTCSILFHKEVLNNNIMKIIVIEFLSNISNISSICDDGNIFVTENYVNSVDLCKLFRSTEFQNPFVFTTQFSLEVKISDFQNASNQEIKIIATSSKKLNVGESCSEKEITCNFNKNGTCISTELRCDGNINCGRKNQDDEDANICKKQRKKSLTLLVLLSIPSVIFLTYTIVYRIRKWCPKLKKHFFIRHKSEEDTIVLSNYTPAIKTYIPKKEVKTLHLRVASTNSSKSSQSDEEFVQAGFYKVKNQNENDSVSIKKQQ